MPYPAQRFHLAHDLVESRGPRERTGHQHDVPVAAQAPLEPPQRFPQPAFRPVPLHGAAQAAASGDTDLPWSVRRPEVQDEGISGIAPALPVDSRKLPPVAQTIRETPGLWGPGGGSPAYDGVRRRRARWRRRRRTFRPPTVRIRARNPWVLSLCRLFGWNGRFTPAVLPARISPETPPPLRRPFSYLYIYHSGAGAFNRAPSGDSALLISS